MANEVDKLRYNLFKTVVKEIFSKGYVRMRTQYSSDELRIKVCSLAQKGFDDSHTIVIFTLSGEKVTMNITADPSLSACSEYEVQKDLANPDLIPSLKEELKNHYKNVIRPLIDKTSHNTRDVMEFRYFVFTMI